MTEEGTYSHQTAPSDAHCCDNDKQYATQSLPE